MKNTNLNGKRKFSATRFAALSAAFLCVALVGGAFFGNRASAANPAAGSIGATLGASVNWSGTLSGTPPAANGEPSCAATTAGTIGNCDDYVLTVSGASSDWTGKRIRVRFSWAAPSTDYDMVVRKETNNIPGLQGDGVAPAPNLDAVIGTSGNGTNTFEEVVISPADTGTGVYYVRAVYFAANPADQYNAAASVFDVSTNLTPSACAAPTFDNYQPPATVRGYNDAGEPSIGVNWNTGNIMTQAGLYSIRSTFTDSTSPASPTSGVSWFSQRNPVVITGFDPILFTDSLTGRTIGGELEVAAGTTVGGVSDDDLNTFAQNFDTGGPTQGFDHQTIGGGAPNPTIAGRQPTTAYPHLFYYATQQNAYGTLATSFDGGLSYGPAVTMYTIAQCSSALHGHIKVAPDGTVYVPNKNCGGKASVAVSENNGLTFSVRSIPTSSNGNDDPSVGIGAGGRLFVGYTAADGHPHVAASDDRGLTWRDDVDLGLGFPGGIRASVFPSVVAGDNNRAAVFFVGTNSNNPNDPTGTDGAPVTGADTNAADNFLGTWYPYVATTCDGGKSWSVVRADNDPLRPGVKNPVQQGVVCKNGTTCPGGPPDTRNLLDFNDVTVDAKGRILGVYADGCISANCINLPDNSTAKEGNDGASTLTVLRQRGGMRLFGAFDTNGPAAPTLSPPVEIETGARSNRLQWATPDDNGSTLTAYRIYRGAPGKSESLIAEVAANVNSFRDRMPEKSRRNKGETAYFYHVTAVNAYGESPRNFKAVQSKGE